MRAALGPTHCCFFRTSDSAQPMLLPIAIFLKRHLLSTYSDSILLKLNSILRIHAYQRAQKLHFLLLYSTTNPSLAFSPFSSYLFFKPRMFWMHEAKRNPFLWGTFEEPGSSHTLSPYSIFTQLPPICFLHCEPLFRCPDQCFKQTHGKT